MSKFLRYMGEFLSHAGVVWRGGILPGAEAALHHVGRMLVEEEGGVLLVWGEENKEES